MILAILFAWLGYKKAKENGRSGVLWAFLAAGTFILTQIIVSLVAGAIIATILLSQGVPAEEIEAQLYNQSYNLIVTLIAIVFSIITGMIVLYFANKPVADTENYNVPPPPTSFGQHS